MSRYLVESHLSKALTAKLRIRFGHMNKFITFPGPVVFLIALDICHASVAQDIEGAKTSLYALSLPSYHGENVTECVTEAQSLVKIMQRVCSAIGSMLLNKFTSTSSKFFNCLFHNLQDKVKRMEQKYKLTDPKAILKDLEYHLLGTLGIIALLQKEHSDHLAEKQWPVLSAIAKPQSNLAESSNGNGNTGPGRRCFVCQDSGHLANCCSNRKNNMSSTVQTSNKSVRPLEEWKYCRPADLTKALTIYGKEWKSSVPDANVGQLSHWAKDQIDGYG